MVTYLVGTDGTRTSTALCDYLGDMVTDGDTIHAIYALGETPSREAIDQSEEALARFTEQFGETVEVEFHNPIRSTEPAEELLITANEVDADWIVIGLRQHNLAERVIFGSTAQEVLKKTPRPVIAVPLDTARSRR